MADATKSLENCYDKAKPLIPVTIKYIELVDQCN
jgi:hypothetical protein